MPHITLTPEQVQILTQATTTIEIRDEQGRILASVAPPGEQDIIQRVIERRNQPEAENEPRYPAHDVQARLQKLEELREAEGMDQEKMQDYLQRMRAGETL